MPRTSKNVNEVKIKELTKEIIESKGVSSIGLEFIEMPVRIKVWEPYYDKMRFESECISRRVEGEQVVRYVLSINLEKETWVETVMMLFWLVYLLKIDTVKDIANLQNYIVSNRDNLDSMKFNYKYSPEEGYHRIPSVKHYRQIYVQFEEDADSILLLIKKLIRYVNAVEVKSFVVLSRLPKEYNEEVINEERTSMMSIGMEESVSCNWSWIAEMKELLLYKEKYGEVYSKEYYAVKCELLEVLVDAIDRFWVFDNAQDIYSIRIPDNLERKEYTHLYDVWHNYNKGVGIFALEEKACFMHRIYITENVHISVGEIKEMNEYREEIVKYYFVAFPINLTTVKDLVKRYPVFEQEVMEAIKEKNIKYLVTEVDYMGRYY